MSWTGLLLVLGLLLASGCRTDCRELCTVWYDYQQEICGDLDTDDARVQCLADYRSGLVSDDEADECGTRIETILETRDLNDSGARQACCDGRVEACNNSL